MLLPRCRFEAWRVCRWHLPTRPFSHNMQKGLAHARDDNLGPFWTCCCTSVIDCISNFAFTNYRTATALPVSPGEGIQLFSAPRAFSTQLYCGWECHPPCSRQITRRSAISTGH